MTIKYFRWLSAAALMPAILLAGCSHRDEASVGTPANPLVMVLSPAHSPSASSGALDFIKKHLETSSGLSVELRVAQSPAEAVNAFASGKTDAGIVTLEEYLVAREEYSVSPELQVLRGEQLEEYEGVILAGSAMKPAELAGKKVGFVGPYSVSGFMLPSLYLKKAGITVVPEFIPGHDANLRKLLEKNIDAAATYARQASRYPGLKIVAVTGKVPNEPLIVRRKLAADKRQALAEAFLSMGDTPEGLKALGAVADITGFRPVDAAVYKPLHEIILSEGGSIYDLIPEGWDIYKLNQPYYPD